MSNKLEQPAKAPAAEPDPATDMAPQTVTHPSVAANQAVNEAVAASEARDAELVAQFTQGTHPITTSLLHSDSHYIEKLENGVKKIEQLVSHRR